MIVADIVAATAADIASDVKPASQLILNDYTFVYNPAI